MEITVRDGAREETLDVTNVKHDTKKYDDDGPLAVGEESWVIEGIHPSETDLIPSEYVWLSGSLGEPMSDEQRKRFPLVYVPKNGDLEVTSDEDDR